jgi:Protein phosphatase 2C
VDVSVFRIPKAGSTRAEYEDAVAWSTRRRRFAVADGASASAFARLWAELLARAYTAGKLRTQNLQEDLLPLQSRWIHNVESRDLPWYAAEQVRRGAFAALVGLTVLDDATWTAFAVGDSCLFHMRNGELLQAFPITDPDEFGNSPFLIGSRAPCNDEWIHATEGAWEPGDTFLLMSDALAALYLKDGRLEMDRFRAWVNRMRAERLLRNDDVSLLHLAMPAHAAA